jgi:hypothetical protein
MLDLTHHLIVKYAAYKVGYKNFNSYIVLGDDIVIANEAVANEYFRIMTADLKVGINLAKSVVSHHGYLEFAKRIRKSQNDYTPLSLKEFSS